MNKITIVGRLVKDPEERRTADNKEISKFTVAVDREYRKEITDFIPCTCFGSTASFINKYLKKGNPIAVCGSMVQTKYTSTKTGKTVISYEVLVSQVQTFSERKAPNEEPKETDYYTPPAPPTDDADLLSDDDLPF